MTGAIIQLVAKGLQDIFITKDPQITYFKIVYRRHTNFSMEAIPQYFKHTPNFGNKYTCDISPNGDLMGKTHLVVVLPKIKQQIDAESGTYDKYLKFAWVKKIGYALIKNIELEIGGQLISRHYGDWLNIMDELFTPIEHRRAMDKMIGNYEDLYTYTSNKDQFILYIPLQFYFCRFQSSAIPLLCLHHSEVKINIEISDFDRCYVQTPTSYIEMYDDIVPFEFGEYFEQNINGIKAAGMFSNFDPVTRRMYYTQITRNKIQSLPYSSDPYTYSEIMTFYPDYLLKSRTTTKFSLPNPGSTPKLYNVIRNTENYSIVECFLLVNYIYLDTEERNKFVQTKHEYLVDELHILNPQVISSSNYMAHTDTVNPCRFMAWHVKQVYLSDKNNNDYFNYTDDYLYLYNNGKYTQTGKSLVTTEGIQFNGFDRISSRDCKYFNNLQPYQHFKNSMTEGLNVYSFSLQPSEFQPSGTCNMSYVGSTVINLNLTPIINDNNNAVFVGYSLAHNILRIMDGLAGTVFVR